MIRFSEVTFLTLGNGVRKEKRWGKEKAVKCHSWFLAASEQTRARPPSQHAQALPMISTEKLQGWQRQRSVAAHLRASSRIQKKSPVYMPEVL